MDDEEDVQGKDQGKGHDHRQEQDVKGSRTIRISGRSRRGTSRDRKTMMKNTRMSTGKSRSKKIRRMMKSSRSSSSSSSSKQQQDICQKFVRQLPMRMLPRCTPAYIRVCSGLAERSPRPDCCA